MTTVTSTPAPETATALKPVFTSMAAMIAETARIFAAAGCTPESLLACPEPAVRAAGELLADPSLLPALAGMDAVWEASGRCPR